MRALSKTMTVIIIMYIILINSHTKFGFNGINHVRQIIMRKIETVSIFSGIDFDATVMKNLYRFKSNNITPFNKITFFLN